jgi:protoporphyrinogen oxidase
MRNGSCPCCNADDAGCRLYNFGEWIERAFGDGLARHFMVPYNEKIWAHPLETMEVRWIAERVPPPDLGRVLTNLRDSKDDPDWGPNARFRYPRHGGAGAIWRRVAERVGRTKIRFRWTVARIDATKRRVHFSDGAEESYDALVSIMPLNRLVAMAGLDGLDGAAAALSSSTVHVVGVGIEGTLPPELVDRKWIYFPEPDLPFYRMTVLSNFSQSNAPAGHWSLLAEVAASPYRTVDDLTIVEDVIAGAFRAGIIPARSPIVSRFHRVAAPGYPVPTKARDSALAVLLPSFEALDIYSRGRFGAWRYEISNQDHCFLQGAELVGRLILGEAEPTLSS